MSLQVWLQLNGNLNNYGLGEITYVTGSYTSTIGKTGQAHNANIPVSCYCPQLFRIKTFSIAFWVKADSKSGYTSDWNKSLQFGDLTASGDSGNRLRFESTYNYSPRACSVHNNTKYAILTDSVTYAVDKDQWYHICLTCDGSTVKHYANGTLFSTTTANGGMLDGSIYIGTSAFYGAICDIRVYDNVITANEVKEISRGLILHHKFDNGGIGNSNLLRNADKFTRSNPYISTSTSKDGYTVVGIYANGLDTSSKYTLTVECDGELYTHNPASHNPSNMYWTIWTYQRATNYTDSEYSGYTTPWCWEIGNLTKRLSPTRYQWTFVPQYSCVSIRFNTYSDGTNPANVKFWNVQLEKGDKATPWSPPSGGSISNALNLSEYVSHDVSGYGRDATLKASIDVMPSPRYDTAYLMKNNTAKVVMPPIDNVSGFNNSYTFSWWECIPSSLDGFMAWGYSDGNRLNLYHNSGLYWNVGDGTNNPFRYPNGTNVPKSILADGKWHHVVVTGNGSQTKLYVDGIYIGSSITYRPITGTIIYVSGWDTSTTYTIVGGGISDFRIYATTLSDTAIKELYSTAASIDKNGSVFCYNLTEE